VVEKEKIKKLVKEVVDKNKLQNCFIPIIEEFFFRASDQLDWNDEELNNAIKRYEKVVNIKFINMYERGHILKKYKKGRAFSNYEFKKQRIFVCFDVDDLKDILEFDKQKIEEFINIAMHEQGHSIQYQKKENKVNCGFCEDRIINKYGIKRVFSSDCIINEFAEIINAARLQNGNIKNNKYSGYETIQTAGKIILNSLGISELELADLQFKPNAREEYENLIANNLGRISSEMYRDSFGKILDAIFIFSIDTIYDEEEDIFIFSNNEKQRQNLILQIDSLQTLSKDLFEKRFYDIIRNSDNALKDLAKLSIEQGHAESELALLFDEFNIESSELKINESKDIHTMLSALGYDDKYLEELYDIECDELIKMQNQKDKQKKYDNEELIERLYQSFFKYPIRKVPLKDRPGVILSKINGMKKRKALKQAKLLPEPNITNYDSHTEFINRISDLEEYKEKDIIQHENWITEVEEERDNSDESSREN